MVSVRPIAKELGEMSSIGEQENSCNNKKTRYVVTIAPCARGTHLSCGSLAKLHSKNDSELIVCLHFETTMPFMFFINVLLNMAKLIVGRPATRLYSSGIKDTKTVYAYRFWEEPSRVMLS